MLEALDNLKTIKRDPDAALRVPIIDRYKDMGFVIALGKVESGVLVNNTSLVLMPSGQNVDIVNIFLEDLEVSAAKCGENVNVLLKGCDISEVHAGDVLCSIDNFCPSAISFECQMIITELLEHKPLMTAGYLCVLHIHTASVECEIEQLIVEIDSKTGKKMKRIPTFVRSSATIQCRIKVANAVAIERYKDSPQLGRFTLRDEGKTIAIGKVLEIYELRNAKQSSEK